MVSDLVWIAVPHRLLDGSDERIVQMPGTTKLRRPAVVRVAVVPRLEGGILGTHGLGDWPRRLREELTFQMDVMTSDGVHEAPTAPTLFDPVAQLDVWNTVFRGDAAVLYARPPRQDQELPEDLANQYDNARKISSTYRKVSKLLAEESESDARDRVLEQIRDWETSARPVEPRAPYFVEEGFDFRRTFGLLREHPEVLRDLGLVFELLVEGDELTAGDSSEQFLAIRSDTLGGFVTSPWTRYEIDDGGFWPGADPERQGGARRGVVDLSGADRVDVLDDDAGTPQWAIATFDVDGGVTDLEATAKVLASGQITDAALPALRSSGLMLLRPGRQQDFDDRLKAADSRATNRAQQKNGGDHLSADDLVLGYRLDVISAEDPTWRSLCGREASYWVTDDETQRRVEIGSGRGRSEEGHVKHLAAVRGEDGVVRADQILVRWDGWSLAVPPLSLMYEAEPAQQPPSRDRPYHLNWQFVVPPGSLARLRFGWHYRLRIRVADIAGGGPDLDALRRDEGASNEVVYRRAEPVPPPRRHLDASQLPGAAVDRLVIRSDHGMSVEDFLAAEPHYATVDTCTLYPPTAPFALIEQHGAFDPPKTDHESWLLAARTLDVQSGDHPVEALPDPAASGVAAYVAPADGGVERPLWQSASWGRWPDYTPKTVVAGDDPTGDAPISLDWDASGDKLHVNLAKGEEAEVELSSTIALGQLRKFAVHEWLDRGQFDADDAYRGRHPMLSPSVKVHVVHAVRRPLVDPLWRSPVPVSRAKSDTVAVVSPEFAQNGLDTDSTSRIEVAGSWEDWDDDTVTQVTADRVHHQDVDRGDIPPLRFRHEFADTKHRDVIYTVKAVSRFRRFFEPSDPDEAFEAVGEQERVIVKSSARPPLPEVLAVVPGFRWSTETTDDRIVRRRSSNRLVVELARPWYITGAGETLGVVATLENEPAYPVTEVSGDPVYGRPPRIDPYPRANWFEGDERSVKLPDTDTDVSVIGSPVTLAGNRWQAEVVLRVPEDVRAYRPFIRLAVTRYQPDSIEDLELSRVVTTGWVSLMPDREITVEQVGWEMHVHVNGINPEAPNRVDVTVDECITDGDAQDVGLTAVDDDMSDREIPVWRALPGFSHSDKSPGEAIVVPLPSSDRPLRLRIREIEDLDPLGDRALADEGLDTMPPELRERTVLVDHIPIPAHWLREGTEP